MQVTTVAVEAMGIGGKSDVTTRGRISEEDWSREEERRIIPDYMYIHVRAWELGDAELFEKKGRTVEDVS